MQFNAAVQGVNDDTSACMAPIVEPRHRQTPEFEDHDETGCGQDTRTTRSELTRSSRQPKFASQRPTDAPLVLLLATCLVACSPAASNDDNDMVDAGPLVCPGDDGTVSSPPPLACCSDKDCGAGTLCVAGICARKLDSNLQSTLTDPTADNETSSTAIDLGCANKTAAEIAAGLSNAVSVTLWGRVDRFGAGHLTDDIEIAVFRSDTFKPQACEGLKTTADLHSCLHDEAKVGKPIAKVVSVSPAKGLAKGWSVQSKFEDGQECTKDVHTECPLGYLCDKFDGFIKCGLAHGVYAIEGIPTHVPLIVRASPVDPKHPAGWRDSYIWNVVLFANKLDAKGEKTQAKAHVGKDTIRFNPTIVGKGQWALVPATMSLGKISAPNGVIGGRVRDCGTADRAGWPIINTKVTAAIPGSGQSYFNDSESDTVPSKLRTATNALGRYAIINVRPGPNRIAVTGRTGGKDTGLGWADVYVVPNALVIVSLPGQVPHLNK